MVNYLLILEATLPAVLIAIDGLIVALRKVPREKIRYAEFAKTILLGLVTAGLISTRVTDLIVLALASGVATELLDKLVNALCRPKELLV